MIRPHKHSITLIVLIIACLCLVLSGCTYESIDNESSINQEAQTYRGTVYDVAYGKQQADGLRAKAYTYFLFNTKEQTFVKYVRTTAGTGKTTVVSGTYEGSFEEGIITKYTRNEEYFEVAYSFDEDYMYSEGLSESYPKIEVETAIRGMSK